MSREKQIEEMAHEIKISTGYLKSACRISAEILYNAGYRKQEWISVDERLPEEDGMYLVHHIGLSIDCIRITFFRKGEKYYDYMWKRYYSHWMPLPEAPKIKGGAE